MASKLQEEISLTLHDVFESALDEGFFDHIPGGVVVQDDGEDGIIVSADHRLFKVSLTEIEGDDFDKAIEELGISPV